jgi:hypothetical protein
MERERWSRNLSKRPISRATWGITSDHKEVNSLEGDVRSMDPDNEPRKEGGQAKNMKKSPSVVEVTVNDEHQSDVPSNGDRDKLIKGRSPVGGSRLPVGVHNQITDQSDEDYNSKGGVSLTRDNKHTNSNRKIKPMYAINN